MKNSEKIGLAREFFRQVLLAAENEMSDEIYEEIDPDNDYGEELIHEFNLSTVEEIIGLGFQAKYGVPFTQ